MTTAKEQEIIQKFNFLKQELQQIAQKIGELEQEKEEHQMVTDTLNPVPSDRKCFKLIGGILVEKTVGEVLPTVVKNQEGVIILIDYYFDAAIGVELQEKGRGNVGISKEVQYSNKIVIFVLITI